MDLDRDDFFGPFGVTGTFGAFLLIGGLILGLYAVTGLLQGATIVGQIARLLDPNAQAQYRNMSIILVMGAGVAVFGFFLLAADVYGENWR